MGKAAATYTLWTLYRRHSPENPKWENRDRFVLSAGHGSMLLYAMLHLTGYPLSVEELRNFRQWGSKTPGHPEVHHTPGVETTTGPLGQGVGNGVGMAMAEAWLAARYNRPGFNLVDHYTYVIAGDGCMMEGVASEAASLAGHLQLSKLIVLYDNNGITIDGKTAISFTEDVFKRFEAYGWHVQKIDAMDTAAVAAAIEAALTDTRPSRIGCRTRIGVVSPNNACPSDVHGEALGEEELKLTKENLGWPLEPRFFVPDDVRDFYHKATGQGRMWEAESADLLEAYAREYPAEADEYRRIMAGELADGWADALPHVGG